LALYANNADFHALAGQLWTLQGEFRQAIKAWKKAQQLDPQHSTAGACLECLMAF
jgi:tetratricopeptide (TPR) repeat protein